jgi:hypothetical protein
MVEPSYGWINEKQGPIIHYVSFEELKFGKDFACKSKYWDRQVFAFFAKKCVSRNSR